MHISAIICNYYYYLIHITELNCSIILSSQVKVQQYMVRYKILCVHITAIGAKFNYQMFILSDFLYLLAWPEDSILLLSPSHPSTI